jgi:DNA-binding NarL/FixJ family response regulator
MPLQIIIADDHPLLVDGLRRVIEEIEDLEVLEPVNNGRQLLASLRQAPVDIVLLDLQMPHLDGIETLKTLRLEFPRIKVLVFSNYNQPKLVREIRSLGAKGFLPKSSTSLILKEAVRTVLAGGCWFKDIPSPAPDTEGPFMDDFMRKYRVTQREVEILRKIAEGFTSKEIGEQLFISEYTIHAHRRNICRKLEIYTPVGLVNFAKEHGLI